MKRRIINNILLGIVAWLLSLIILAPIYLLIMNSLKDQTAAKLMTLYPPEVFHWENYLIAIKEGHMIRSFLNSLLLAGSSAIINIFTSSMAAFVLSRRRSKINKAIYYYFLIGLVAPLNMITVIRTLQVFNIMGSYQGFIALYAGWLMPFGVFLYYGFIGSIPRELDEAAIIDGANSFTLFFKVIFPLMKPVTITLLILNFMNVWNDFQTPLYILNRATKWPMTLAVYNFYGQRLADWQLVSATIVLTVAPIVIIFLVGQKYIISGMTSGAVKG
ncbi:MAG: carbohydrate ABC transporter permease [Candidatus Humimicrobiaceae bacterium]